MKQTITFILILASLIAQAQEPEMLTLLNQWKDSTLVGSRTYDNTYNEVWGLAVNGHEFAVIGSTWGTHIFDVTNPMEMEEVIRIPGKDQGSKIIHRDYHDFDCYLYAVSDEGASSLQIIDISSLPDTAIVVYDNDAIFQRTHNIFIDSASAKLYGFATTGTGIGSSAMIIADLSDPTNPAFIDEYRTFDNIRAGHVHDAFVIKDTAYLNCGTDGFAIVDFSDPANPITLNTLKPSEYPGAGYNHSCWRSDDGSAVYMADETWGSDVKVVDVRDYNNLDISALIDAGSDDPNSIAHNQVVACNNLYVSYYYDGLQVYDISDPLNPVRSHYYPTTQISHRRNYEGSWGVYPLLPSGLILVSDMQEGLLVLAPIDSDCNDVQSCQITTNNEDVLKSDLLIFPNPTSEYFSIQSESSGMLHISSMTGILMDKKLLQQGENKVSTENWASGIYILDFSGNTYKIVKH